MKKILVIAFFLFTITAVSAQTADEKYRKEYNEILESSVMNHFVGIMMQNLENMANIYPQDKAAKVRALSSDIEQIFTDFLQNEALEIYQKYISYEDLRKLNKFNRSPAGRRILGSQKDIMDETMKEAEKLGAKIMEMVNRVVNE